MKTAVVVFPGSNCDQDAVKAAGAVSGGSAVTVWHKDSALPAGTDLVILPGGFSYGDYLRSGVGYSACACRRSYVSDCPGNRIIRRR